MVINDVEIDMDERVWQQLLALPYSIELDEEGHLVMTPLQGPGLTFEQLASTHPILPNDLYWKVETNARNQIIMSPPPHTDHNEFGTEIMMLLLRLLPHGRSIMNSGFRQAMEQRSRMSCGFRLNADESFGVKSVTQKRRKSVWRCFHPATVAEKLRRRSSSVWKPVRGKSGPADATAR